MKKPAPTPPPTGLCFPYANTALRLFGDDAVVVHARIKTATGKRIWHAWIEHRGRVYDWQNCAAKPATRPCRGIARATYYATVKPRAVATYTPTEACVRAIKTRHHGPWKKEQ